MVKKLQLAKLKKKVAALTKTIEDLREDYERANFMELNSRHALAMFK